MHCQLGHIVRHQFTLAILLLIVWIEQKHRVEIPVTDVAYNGPGDPVPGDVLLCWTEVDGVLVAGACKVQFRDKISRDVRDLPRTENISDRRVILRSSDQNIIDTQTKTGWV